MTRFDKLMEDVKHNSEKTHKVNGYVYFGCYFIKENNKPKFLDIFKIGMTTDTLKARASQITTDKGQTFTILKAIKVNNTTKEFLELMESLLRVRLSQMNGIEYIKASHDHFYFTNSVIKNNIKNLDWYDELSTSVLTNLIAEAQFFMNDTLEASLEHSITDKLIHLIKKWDVY